MAILVEYSISTRESAGAAKEIDNITWSAYVSFWQRGSPDLQHGLSGMMTSQIPTKSA